MTTRIILVNNFSLNMVNEEDIQFVRFNRILTDELKDDLSWCSLESHIGSPEIAHYLTSHLGTPVEANRKNIVFDGSCRMIVASMSGRQIEMGTTVLPRGVKLRFMEVIIDRITLYPMQDFEALALTSWPLEQLEKEGPTMIRINWKNGETTHIQVAPGMDGEWAAYVHSRSGRQGDFIAACGQQTWQDVILKEEQA